MTLSRAAILAGSLGVAVWPVWANPKTEEYLRFVEGELMQALDRMDERTTSREQQFIREMFRRQAPKLVEGVVAPQTVRKNFGLFSLYTTKVKTTEVMVIGVAGRFVPIKGVEEATLEVGRLAF